ncbi:MAG: undecaprenyl-phosphate glucose phosphotransferase [Muribaculaceae bacterium]|nr:undecaprenyl-phosphate glucose phosphotransferase [Muribaculaceae bacterium]MDE6321727.1 undecaprenyl-phosphate glucose phosphotransferase [Muribaculaceae bacterium]
MTSHPKGRYGDYIHTVLTVVDFVQLNLLFWIILLFNPEISHSAYMRQLWLLVNVSFFPVVYWFARVQTSRTVYMDHIFLSAIQAVGIHALFFLSLQAFLGIFVIPWWAYMEFYGMCLVLYPLLWVLERFAIKAVRRHGRNFVRVVIVGNNQTSRRLAAELASDVGFGYRLMGYFDDETTDDDPILGRYLGTIDQLDTYAREHFVSEVYYCISGNHERAIRTVVKMADDSVSQFFYVPQIPRYINRAFEMSHRGRVPVLAIRHNPLKNFLNLGVKRAFDLTFSSVVLLLFFPLVFIPVAIAIKMSSPGPIFFRQKRTGYKGRDFYCYKFRTMKVNVDADRAQATKDDPRKTRIGDILRKTSIDELPQFINVWLGDMSVVGPRPHMLKHTETYSKIIDKYMVRHLIKPGITGWAQVNGYRGQTEELWQMERRVEYDVWYIENWSFLLDMKIIVRTIINAVKGEQNAY